VFTHGATSKNMLQIDWDYPVHVPPPESDDNATRARPVRRALPLAEAMAAIIGKDRRPLLVLRECLACRGTDLALLSREFANERTILLTDWFHCVKLPANVAAADHPFHALFPNHSHLFLAKSDGTGIVRFDGRQAQQSLWKVMGKVLEQSYRGNPERSVKELLKLLVQFDIIDDKESRLLRECDEALETKGPQSSRFLKLKRELEAVNVERQKLLSQEKRLRSLALRPIAQAR